MNSRIAPKFSIVAEGGRIATPPALSSGVAASVYLELYPGLLIFYAAGIAAVAVENWLLRRRFRKLRADPLVSNAGAELAYGGGSGGHSATAASPGVPTASSLDPVFQEDRASS
jgi:hypothetical protein